MEGKRVGRTRVRAGFAVCAAVLAASAGTASAASLQAAATPEARADSAEQAARAYARQYDVGFGEARATLALQAKGAELPERLAEKLGGELAQVRIERDRFVVALGPGADETVARDVIAGMDLAGEVRIERVAWTDADLRSELRRVGARLADQIEDGTVQVGTHADGIRITVSSDATREERAEVAQDAQRSAAALVPTTVVESEQPLAPAAPQGPYVLPGFGDPPMIGGMTTQICTLAFPASSPVNTSPYMLTAGHCISPGAGRVAYRANGAAVSLGVDVGGYVTGDGDAGVVQVTNPSGWPTYPGVINWIDTWGTTPVFGVAPSTVNAAYCHTGAGSPEHGHTATTCGRNTGLSVVNYPGYPQLILQTLRGNVCGFPGDSGGPVFDWGAGNAIGIWSGGPSGGGCGSLNSFYYTDAGHAASVLGVTINEQ